MPWREPNEQREPSSLLEWQSREEEDKVKWSDLFQSLLAPNSLMADLGLITTGGSDTSYFSSPSAFLMRLIASTMFSSLVA